MTSPKKNLLLSLAIVLLLAAVAQACPNCKETLSSDPTQQGLAKGIYYSILFMMSMPFAIVGTFGCLAYRAVKREQRRVAEANKSQDDTPPAHS